MQLCSANRYVKSSTVLTFSSLVYTNQDCTSKQHHGGVCGTASSDRLPASLAVQRYTALYCKNRQCTHRNMRTSSAATAVQVPYCDTEGHNKGNNRWRMLAETV
eukprot:8520-Heterococcus_DN1.PRE.2